ncbi:carbonic anhydrase [Burkholderia cepacia]|uniref:Carbonic anhydrase n=1 Tax=Burkholderia cepacia TaxID=292 RepID=A0A2S8I9L7_BURCE|nr:carbonic anhydrase [Burkholderia cepacia]PQP11415.1 carbonic anhydrase [Burkholderia cepacia]HDR9511002.1 carbonic anhydrase [Burkholderia cepacia]
MKTDQSTIDTRKRQSLYQLCNCCAALGTTFLAGTARARTGEKTTLTAEQALTLLKDGNQQFLSDQVPKPALIDHKRRIAIARGQHPFAVFVSCADSRVPPELLFGRGLGELFIVRNAGNTVDTIALGSIEYAVSELGVPLIVVMGHQRCGAVAAALDVVEKNTVFPGSIGPMIEPIIPAVLSARAKMDQTHARDRDALLDAAVSENVRRVVERLRNAETLLNEPLRAKRIKIVGARYSLDDGRVTFLSEDLTHSNDRPNSLLEPVSQ